MSEDNLSLWFLTRSHTNQAIQPQNMARDMKFQISEEEGLHYHHTADLRLCFHLCKKRFSHEVAQMVSLFKFFHGTEYLGLFQLTIFVYLKIFTGCFS